MTLNMNLCVNAVSIAGGPMQAMPERIHNEIVARCRLYGYDLEPGTESVKTLAEGECPGRLQEKLTTILERADVWDNATLQQLLAEARKTLQLSAYAEVDQLFGDLYRTDKYLPVSAFAIVMQMAGNWFPEAKKVPVTFDGNTVAIITLPDDIGQADRLDSRLAKFAGAVCVNQAVTRGFTVANFSDASSVCEALAPFALPESVSAEFSEVPRSCGMRVISEDYYHTWKAVCDRVRADRPLFAGSVADDSGEASVQLRVGVDIGGTEVKIAILKCCEDDWEVCVLSDGECLSRCKTDDVIVGRDDELADAADRIIERICAAVDQFCPGGRVVHVGIVFPAAIALQRAIGGTSGTAARFKGQTPVIVDARPEQLLEVDVRGAVSSSWRSTHEGMPPQIVLTNDGPAFAKGAMLATDGRPVGIGNVKNLEGAFGAIGAASL